jgi:hypothetical protein
MMFWYVPWLRNPVVAAWRGSDPWGSVCSFLTGVQVCSVVTTTIESRSLRPWALENAWEFLVLFQINGNRRLDLYPILDYTIMEDARLFVAAWSITLLIIAEFIELAKRRLLPTGTFVRMRVGQVSSIDPPQTPDAAQNRPLFPESYARTAINPCADTTTTTYTDSNQYIYNRHHKD